MYRDSSLLKGQWKLQLRNTLFSFFPRQHEIYIYNNLTGSNYSKETWGKKKESVKISSIYMDKMFIFTLNYLPYAVMRNGSNLNSLNEVNPHILFKIMVNFPLKKP